MVGGGVSRNARSGQVGVRICSCGSARAGRALFGESLSPRGRHGRRSNWNALARPPPRSASRRGDSASSAASDCASAWSAWRRPARPRSVVQASRMSSMSDRELRRAWNGAACAPWARWRRRCAGVVGIHSPGQDAAGLAHWRSFALQHRGQELAGVGVSDGRGVMVYKDLAGRPGARRASSRSRCAVTLRSPTAATPRPVRRSGRTASRRCAWAPARTVAVGAQRQPRQHRASRSELPGGKSRLVGTTDTDLLTALLAIEPAPGHRRRAASAAAARAPARIRSS